MLYRLNMSPTDADVDARPTVLMDDVQLYIPTTESDTELAKKLAPLRLSARPIRRITGDGKGRYPAGKGATLKTQLKRRGHLLTARVERAGDPRAISRLRTELPEGMGYGSFEVGGVYWIERSKTFAILVRKTQDPNWGSEGHQSFEAEVHFLRAAGSATSARPASLTAEMLQGLRFSKCFARSPGSGEMLCGEVVFHETASEVRLFHYLPIERQRREIGVALTSPTGALDPAVLSKAKRALNQGRFVAMEPLWSTGTSNGKKATNGAITARREGAVLVIRRGSKAVHRIPLRTREHNKVQIDVYPDDASEVVVLVHRYSEDEYSRTNGPVQLLTTRDP